MARRANLAIVFEEFPVHIRSYSGIHKQRYIRKVELRHKAVTLDIEALKEKIKNLQERYPDKGFYLEKHMVRNLSFQDTIPVSFIRRKGASRRMMCWIMGRREKGGKNIPLYWSPRFHRLYVPWSYIRHQKRLTSSVILYRLRDLGIPYALGYA